MKVSWHLGLLIGIAGMASGTEAFAQAPTGTGTSTGTTASNARATARALAARRPDNRSFNRVTTTGRSATAGTPRSAYATASTATVAALAQDDPLRPYSPRARAAEQQAAMRTTRPTVPQQVAVVPRTTQPHNYYPSIRITQHPNANVPQTRAHCTPSRGGVMMGGMGMGGSAARGR